jgi:GNAT superfamily N-acetyltransferase
LGSLVGVHHGRRAEALISANAARRLRDDGFAAKGTSEPLALAIHVIRSSVRLESVSKTEYARFIEDQIEEFASQKVRAGQWQPEQAEALSRHAVESFLPRSGPAAGHRVWKAVDTAGRPVARIWIGPPPLKMPNVPTRRWLYQITVEPAVRGQGYGRATLAAVEEFLAEEGVSELYLNVFRWNTIARKLYDSMGYEVIHDGDSDTGMKKMLRRRRDLGRDVSTANLSDSSRLDR